MIIPENNKLRAAAQKNMILCLSRIALWMLGIPMSRIYPILAKTQSNRETETIENSSWIPFELIIRSNSVIFTKTPVIPTNKNTFYEIFRGIMANS